MAFKYTPGWGSIDISDEKNWVLVCRSCGQTLGVHSMDAACPASTEDLECPKAELTPNDGALSKQTEKVSEYAAKTAAHLLAVAKNNASLLGSRPAENPTDTAHPLQETFDAVIAQVTKGKGERHGGDATPFFEQRWYAIAKSTGAGGLMFQGIKKAEEACEKPDQETFERELLGAIAYLGMAYLFVQKHGFKTGGGG